MAAFLTLAAITLAATLISSALTPLPPTVGKLDNLNLPKAELGVPVPIVFNEQRINGNMCYATNISQKFDRGHNGFLGLGKVPDVLEYNFIDCCFLFSEGEISDFHKIFLGGRLIDRSDTPARRDRQSLNSSAVFPFDSYQRNTVRFKRYLRALQKFPGARDEARLSISRLKSNVEDDFNLSRYNGISKIFFNRLKISEFGGQVPNVEAVIRTAPISLDAVVGRILDELKINTSGYDLSNLASVTAPKFKWLRDGEEPKSALDDLALIYNFSLYVDTDNIIRAKLHTETNNITLIPDAVLHSTELDAGAISGISRSATPVQELPSAIKMSYNNPMRDFEVGSIYVEKSDVTHQNIINIQTSVALTNIEANEIGLRILYNYYAQRFTYSGIVLPPSFRSLEIADMIEFNFHGELVQARITQLEIGRNGLINIQAVSVDTVQRRPQQDITEVDTSQEVFALGNYSAIVLDTPFVFEDAQLTQPDMQSLIAASVDTSGSNVTISRELGLYVDRNEGEDFAQESFLTEQSIILRTDTILTNDDNIFPTDEVLEADVVSGEESITRLINSQQGGLIYINDELIEFESIEALPNNLVRLRGLTRGVLNTRSDVRRHVVNTTAYVLTNETLARTILNRTLIGSEVNYALLDASEDIDDVVAAGQTQSAINNGRSLKPFPVTQVKATRLPNGGIRFSWQPRARYNNHGLDGSYELTDLSSYHITIDGTPFNVTEPLINVSAADLVQFNKTNVSEFTLTVQVQGILTSNIVTQTVVARDVLIA